MIDTNCILWSQIYTEDAISLSGLLLPTLQNYSAYQRCPHDPKNNIRLSRAKLWIYCGLYVSGCLVDRRFGSWWWWPGRWRWEGMCYQDSYNVIIINFFKQALFSWAHYLYSGHSTGFITCIGMPRWSQWQCWLQALSPGLLQEYQDCRWPENLRFCLLFWAVHVLQICIRTAHHIY